MQISLTDRDRYFSSHLHAAIVDEENGQKQVIFASFLGLPEAVRAVNAGLIEGREVKIEQQSYARAMKEPYKFLLKPIGIGDVAHCITYHSHVTVNGVTEVANVKEEDIVKAYILAPDGNIEKAVSEHFIQRFSLPGEWANQYYMLFKRFIKPLSVHRNAAFPKWEDMYAVRLDISEQQVKEMMTQSLRSGKLTVPITEQQGVFEKGMSLKKYLTANAEVLAKKLRTKRPRYLQGTPTHPAIGKMKRIPFPAQAAIVQGLWNAFTDNHDTGFINGVMGTGKSIMACAMMNMFYENQPEKQKKGTAILLSAPSITLAKWRDKEILPTLPHAKVTILHNYVDAVRLQQKVKQGYRPQGLEVYLISLDRAKLGHTPHFAGIWKRVKGRKRFYTWHCPDCHKPLVKKEEDKESYTYLEWEDIAHGIAPSIFEIQRATRNSTLLSNGLPSIPKWRKEAKKFSCCNHSMMDSDHSCESKLWRPAVKNRGETKNKPRTNMARILKRIKNFFSLYIADEIHQAKAEDSGRGDAFGQLVSVAPKRLGLTGTLTTGKSSSIKEILWRTKPQLLLKQGFTHKSSSVQWAKRYGKIKQIIRHEEGDSGWITRQKKKPQAATEDPGINPQLTVQLLDFTAFIDLPDMQLPLVPLKEQVEIIKMDDDHRFEYSRLHQHLHTECMNRSKGGQKGAWSKFIPSTINYADRPDLGAEVIFGKGDNAEKIIAPAFPDDYYHAKERRLISIVKKELSEGRGCVIYNNYTNLYQMNERTQHVLKQHGIDSVILNEPDTMKRSERLQQLEEQGAKVIICNMKLVEVGLDLLAWPTLIFNQLNYEINTVRQAGRRAWRIGQERECRVFYLVNDGSQQMSQFLHLIEQRTHALMVEGVLDKSPLAKFGRDEQSTLASDLASCFADSGMADVWKSLAQKELEDIEIVEESQFKQVLHERMRLLANETRRLCGLPSIEEELAQEEINWQEEPIPAVKMASAKTEPNEESQIDLFELYDVDIVNLDEYREKRRKKAQLPLDGQLGFCF